MVAYAQNPTQSKNYSLAIDHPTLPAGLVVVGTLPQVPVTVIGTTDNLRSFDAQLRSNPGMLHISGNFAGAHVGKNNIPIHVNNPDSNVNIVAPSLVSLAVDELGSATQTVSIERVHALPPGFHEQASATAVTPASVRVDGPKSQLPGIQAVVQVDLDGLQAPGFTSTYPVVIRDANKKVLQMTVTPAQVSVKMTIQADAITLTKPVGFTLTGQPAAGYRISKVEIAPLEVLATGLQNILVSLNILVTDPVDVTGAKTDVIKTVAIRPPVGVEVNQKTVQVHVFISVAPGVSPAPS